MDASEVATRRRTKVPTLTQELRGDLDWITLKALEKDRTRRYASVSEFAADLTRYLVDEPVSARPPSLGYRLQKFVRLTGLDGAAVWSWWLVKGPTGEWKIARSIWNAVHPPAAK